MSHAKFFREFGTQPELRLFSPGRVNLIGEHIDYCGGLVLPMAIDRGTSGWLSSTAEPRLRIYSERFGEVASVELVAGAAKGHWSDFAVGLVALLADSVELCGLNLYVSDNIGGGGLSSSASFSLLVARALLWASDANPESDADWLELAKLCQQVEHEYIGVNCGIMDQASVALGGIVSLDCDSLEFERIQAMAKGYQVIVMDTCHPRALAGSKYNQRVSELAQVQAVLQENKALRQVETLCEYKESELPTLLANLTEPDLQRRLRHVVSENKRVEVAKLALNGGDLAKFGLLMNESHDSLRDDYEVTGSALDCIVDLSREQKGCLGARMTGAGFGGCALALVAADQVAAHNQKVAECFEAETGVVPTLFTVKPGMQETYSS